MKKQNRVEGRTAAAALDGKELLSALLAGPVASAAPHRIFGVIVGELVGMSDEGRTPLVVYPGQPGSAAIAARSVVDLHGAHIGKPVVLVFEGGASGVPIVLGVIRAADAWPLDQKPGQVEVEADGERLTVTAKEELVLRCGEASITLTKAGKVLIHGRYISSRSSGVNRVKGGSVHIN